MKLNFLSAVSGAVLLTLSSGCSYSLLRPDVEKMVPDKRSGYASPAPVRADEVVDFSRKMLSQDRWIPDFSGVKEKRFNFIVRDMPVQAAVQVLADEAGVNVLVAPDVGDRITLILKNVSVVDVLDAIRETYGLEYEINRYKIFLSKPKLVSKTLQVDYLLGARQGRSETKVSSNGLGEAASSSGGQPSGTASSMKTLDGTRITTTLQNDFWGALDQALKSMVVGKDGQEVVLNPSSGMLYVKGFPSQIRDVESYLEKMHSKVSRQVVLEAKIIQVTLSSGSQAGINWSTFDPAGNHKYSLGVNPATIFPQGGGFVSQTALGGAGGFLKDVAVSAGASMGLAFTGTDFAALMSFLQSQGEAQVLSSPRIAAVNNQKAVLKVGTDEFYVTSVTTNSTTSGTSTTTSPSINVQPFFSGVALDVTPQIDADGRVLLHVHPSVSDVAEKSKVVNLGGLGTYTLPLASSSINESDTVVKLNDGDIVAIGGLMSSYLIKDGKKIPVVGDVPLAGEAFKSHSDAFKKSEVVILIKPTVINSSVDWKLSTPGVSK